jgi:hypothetical protein
MERNIANNIRDIAEEFGVSPTEIAITLEYFYVGCNYIETHIIYHHLTKPLHRVILADAYKKIEE